MSNYSFGLNTRNISTSNRTTAAVIIGSLKGGSKGSTSRIYKWCNRHCPADPISCVFQQVTSPVSTPTTSSWTNVSSVLALNLGEIFGNMGQFGEIIIGGGNGGQLQYSTNLGNSWAPYTGSPNLPFLSIGWSSVVMSDDTKFVIGTPYVPTDGISDASYNQYNGVHYRIDGPSGGWFLLQSCPLEGGGTLNFNETGRKLLFIASGISPSGSVMAALTTPRAGSGDLVYLIYSNDFGKTTPTNSWKAISLDPYTQDLVTTVASSISLASSTSEYFLITSNAYYNTPQTKYEYGTSCLSVKPTSTDPSFNPITDISGNNIVYSSMSNDGIYQVVVTATTSLGGFISPIPSRLYLSSDYGTNFSPIIELPYTDNNNYLKFGGVSMSYNGNIITASVFNQGNNTYTYGVFQYIYLSSNFGVTWTKIYNDINGSPISVSGQYGGFLNTNDSGQYQMITGTNQLYINNNYGI